MTKQVNFTSQKLEDATYTAQDTCRLKAAVLPFLGDVASHHICSEGKGESQKGSIRESVGYMKHSLANIVRVSRRVKLGARDGHTGTYKWPGSLEHFFVVDYDTTHIRGN